MAGSAGLQDILGWVALTKAVNAVMDGVPNPLPPWLFSVAAEDKIIGNSTKLNRLYGQRQTARTVKYGAPPRHRAMQPEELRPIKFLSFSEERIFDPYLLQTLRDYNSYDNADKAKRLVANNVKTLGTLFANARIVGVATSLCLGHIYDDGSGNLLPSSSGNTNDYQHQIPTGNIGTVLDAASAGIFGATGGGSWASNSTNIPLQLTRLEIYAGLEHGYEPGIALYGKNAKTYLIQNDYVLDFLARNPTMQTTWLKDNTIPAGLFNFVWAPVYKLSYTKDTGDNLIGTSNKVEIWPGDVVTFCPGESDRAATYGMMEGSNLIPTTIDLIPDAVAAMNSLETRYGAAAYSVVTHKPVSLSVVFVDTWWPAFKVPEAFYIADTVS